MGRNLTKLALAAVSGFTLACSSTTEPEAITDVSGHEHVSTFDFGGGAQRLDPQQLPRLGSPAVAIYDVDNDLEIKVPEGAKRVRIWLALPRAEAIQATRSAKVTNATGDVQTAFDNRRNAYAYTEFKNPTAGTHTLKSRFRLFRKEILTHGAAAPSRPLNRSELAEMSEYLKASRYVTIDHRVRRMAGDITKGQENPVLAAKAIYDWMLANVDGAAKNPEKNKASEFGSTDHAMTTRTGNSADLASLFTSLARAAGVPARMKFGTLLRQSLDGWGEEEDAHAWAEFWAPNQGWIPVDVAMGDIYEGHFALTSSNTSGVNAATVEGYDGPDVTRSAYYFGNLDARRVTLGQGRDILLAPVQGGSLVGSMTGAYVEIDGAVHTDWKRKLRYVAN